LTSFRIALIHLASEAYEGLVGAGEGRGPPGALLVLDTLLVAVDVEAEPCDAVPVAAPERGRARLLEMWGNEVGSGREGV
jgi:hypothetical protein